MDFASIVMKKCEPHLRTIIHLDVDCFYAQVEELRDPTLREKPLGIQQKNIVVTCNYIARQFGLKKLMLLSDAKKLCPSLVLVNGEDLTPYRQMSQQIFDLLINYTPLVEKLGLDENYMDVTSLVDMRLQQQQEQQQKQQLQQLEQDEDMTSTHADSYIYPLDNYVGIGLNACNCGCAKRLEIGAQLAHEIRQELHAKLGITCCAGISFNKLLAKLVGSQNKPNKQTILVSTYTEQFMRELKDLKSITGIGQKTTALLLESGIETVEELQNCDMDILRKKFGFETASKLKDISFGRDNSGVRPSGKPKTISLEDSCRPISLRKDVEERFRLLLLRLLEQVAEDGRIPIAIKVVLRKFDAQKKSSHRESKQANILPSLFKSTEMINATKLILAEGSQEKLLKIIMRLFERIVDLNKPFNITLIGLAFSKFQQRKAGSASIANFLIKKTDLEVQSITSLTNSIIDTNTVCGSPTPSVSSTNSDEGFRSSPTTFQPSDQFHRRRNVTASPIPMLVDNGSESGATNSDFSDFSETEVEPSPKKSRIGRLLMAKRRCFAGDTSFCNTTDVAADVASPSKLRVCDLRLNSRDSEKDFHMGAAAACITLSATTVTSVASVATSNAINTSMLQKTRTVQPPNTLISRIGRLEAGHSFFARQLSKTSSTNSSPLPSPIDEICNNSSSNISTPLTPLKPPTFQVAIGKHKLNNEELFDVQTKSVSINTSASAITTKTTSTTTITGNLSNLPLPADVDPQVFNVLPIDVQNELIASWRRSIVANDVQQSLPNKTPSTTTKTGVVTTAAATAANGPAKATLYHYFLRNK